MATHLPLADKLPPVDPLHTVSATGILDRTNTLFTDAEQTVRLAVGVVVLVLLAVMLVKGGFTFAKLVMALVMGGLAWWIFQGGALPFIGDSINDQVNTGATIVEPTDVTSADPHAPYWT